MGNLLGEAPALEYLNADSTSITVSGFSAGCYMAHRLQIIHSDQIKGAALFSCWPYGTSIDDAWADYRSHDADEWWYSYMQQRLQSQSIDAINEAATELKINQILDLEDVAVYIYSGILDNIVPFWA